MTFNNSELVVSLWDNIRPFIPDKKKADVALSILETLDTNGIFDNPKKDLEEAYGVDPQLDKALDIFLETEKEDEDFDLDFDIDED